MLSGQTDQWTSSERNDLSFICERWKDGGAIVGGDGRIGLGAFKKVLGKVLRIMSLDMSMLRIV